MKKKKNLKKKHAYRLLTSGRDSGGLVQLSWEMSPPSQTSRSACASRDSSVGPSGSGSEVESVLVLVLLLEAHAESARGRVGGREGGAGDVDAEVDTAAGSSSLSPSASASASASAMLTESMKQPASALARCATCNSPWLPTVTRDWSRGTLGQSTASAASGNGARRRAATGEVDGDGDPCSKKSLFFLYWSLFVYVSTAERRSSAPSHIEDDFSPPPPPSASSPIPPPTQWSPTAPATAQRSHTPDSPSSTLAASALACGTEDSPPGRA